MGKHRKKDDESVARHSLNEEPDVKIVENSYSVWREPVVE